MSEELSRMYEDGVALHMEHQETLLQLPHAADLQERDALMERVMELGSQVKSLLIATPQDIHQAIINEALERLLKRHQD